MSNKKLSENTLKAYKSSLDKLKNNDIDIDKITTEELDGFFEENEVPPSTQNIIMSAIINYSKSKGKNEDIIQILSERIQNHRKKNMKKKLNEIKESKNEIKYSENEIKDSKNEIKDSKNEIEVPNDLTKQMSNFIDKENKTKSLNHEMEKENQKLKEENEYLKKLMEAEKCFKYDRNGDKGFIYIVQTQRCKNYIPDGCEVFKIGYTTNLCSRLTGNDYGEGTEIRFIVLCEKNVKKIEKCIISKLKEDGCFDWENEFGREYFSGEISTAIEMIIKIINEEEGYYNWYDDLEENGKWFGKSINDKSIKTWHDKYDGLIKINYDD